MARFLPWCVAIVVLLPPLSPTLGRLFTHALAQTWLVNLLRLTVAFSLVLVPAPAMDLTLPLLTKTVTCRDVNLFGERHLWYVVKHLMTRHLADRRHWQLPGQLIEGPTGSTTARTAKESLVRRSREPNGEPFSSRAPAGLDQELSDAAGAPTR